MTTNSACLKEGCRDKCAIGRFEETTTPLISRSEK
jgi:hypothetical protein